MLQTEIGQFRKLLEKSKFHGDDEPNGKTHGEGVLNRSFGTKKTRTATKVTKLISQNSYNKNRERLLVSRPKNIRQHRIVLPEEFREGKDGKKFLTSFAQNC